MRVLLTGAGGYIGLHLLRELLEHGHTVTALLRAPEQLGPLAQTPGLRVVQADLEHTALVEQALQGQEACVHAALIWGAPGTELELRDSAVTAKLFDAAGRAGVARCLYLSSTAVHRPFSGLMHEDQALSPTDLYGATKSAGELFLRAACAQHGMRGVVIRPGPVVGPPAFPGASFRSDHRITALVAAAVKGQALEPPQGEARQLTGVRSLAKLTRLLLTAEAPHPTYLCVGRELLSWAEIARVVLASLGSEGAVGMVGEPVGARFRTERAEEMLGGAVEVELEEHIRWLMHVIRHHP